MLLVHETNSESALTYEPIVTVIVKVHIWISEAHVIKLLLLIKVPFGVVFFYTINNVWTTVINLLLISFSVMIIQLL